MFTNRVASQAMPKRIEYSREALKTLASIDRATASRIIGKVDLLVSDPRALGNNIRRLRGGEEGRLRLRVGDWRVIYRDGIVLHVIRIAPRGSVYE
jgi:mRNA interferase RelE/StbE